MHAQPGAKHTVVQGLHGEAIKIRVRARPIDGAANAALLEFLAEALQVPGSRCVLVSGETNRQKRVRITAPARALAEARLREWSGGQTNS